MRQLSLHASALNNEEYELYTTCLMDLVVSEPASLNQINARDDAFYEQITVSIREVRAWLRGRYSDISLASIDAILKFFSPVIAQGEVLSGGQFFAALRLVIHVQNGRDPDRSLAFVQAHPASSTVASSLGSASSNYSKERYRSSVSESGSSKSNPFSIDIARQPPVHPSQRHDVTKIFHSSHNPFLTQSKSVSSRSDDDSAKLPPLPPRKYTIPTPPSRQAQTPTSPSNLRPQASNSTMTRAIPTSTPPPPPPKPKPTTHVTSTLMKQSLQASKAAQTMKRAEEQLEKERVLQVLRSTSGTLVSALRSSRSSRSPSSRTPAHSDCSTSRSSEDREKPPLPQRRTRRTSPSISATSLEQVALAIAPSGCGPYKNSSPFDSPNTSPRGRSSIDLPGVTGLPPPTHPDRKPPGWSTTSHEQATSVKRNSEAAETTYGIGQSTSLTPSPSTGSTSPSARMYRSKSLHYQPHPLPPPPPPTRKKRPESIQVLSNGEVRLDAPPSSLNSDSDPFQRVVEQRPISHRRSSLGASFGANISPNTGAGKAGTESIQRTLAGLQLKAEHALPKLEIARYKAEAGLSRRGFIKGEERSRLGTEDRKGLIYNQSYDEQELTVDSSDEFERSEDNTQQVQDDLKWPAGEGWKML